MAQRWAAGVVVLMTLAGCSLFGGEPDWVGASRPLTMPANSCVSEAGNSATMDDLGMFWEADRYFSEDVAGIITYETGDTATFVIQSDTEAIPLRCVDEGEHFPLRSCSF